MKYPDILFALLSFIIRINIKYYAHVSLLSLTSTYIKNRVIFIIRIEKNRKRQKSTHTHTQITDFTLTRIIIDF